MCLCCFCKHGTAYEARCQPAHPDSPILVDWACRAKKQGQIG
ncbi:hypothetical protein ALP32_102328 [Pseudomonas avellanae]|uniref:Uncharacterized protein n=1 Tax=Pseudomonas avellanae TaxID=46257 RepID=A0A3M5TFA7_9PSED|nr:hypothetical protein ALP32_102328 [Pseudomonas avellanae]